MKKILRMIVGGFIITLSLCVLFFDIYMLLQEPSWAMILVFVLIFGFGFALAKLGYSICKGEHLKDALIFLFFLGNRVK